MPLQVIQALGIASVAGVVVALALLNGGFDPLPRHLLGVGVWALVLILLTLGWPRRWPSRLAWLAGGSLAGLTALAGASMLWSESPGRSFEEAARLGAYLGVFVLVVIVLHHIRGARALILGLSAGFGVVIVLAALSRLLPELFPAQDLQRLKPWAAARLTFPLNYWNALALLVAMGVPLFLLLALRPGARLGRFLGMALIPIACLVGYLTFSRAGAAAAVVAPVIFLATTTRRGAAVLAILLGGAGGTVLILTVRSLPALHSGLLETPGAQLQGRELLVFACGVSLAVGSLWLPIDAGLRKLTWEPGVAWKWSSRAVVALIAVMVVVFAASQAPERVKAFRDPVVAQTEDRYSDVSGNGRYQYWRASVAAFQARPVVGLGAGAWELWWRRNATLSGFVRSGHSLPLEVAAELGILGLVLLVALFVAVMGSGVRRLAVSAASARARPAGPDLDNRILMAAALAACAAFIIAVSVDWTWEIPAVTVPFLALAGVLVAKSPTLRSAEHARFAPRLAGGLTVAAVAWIAIFGQGVVLLGEKLVADSESAFRRGDLQTAVQAARTASAMQPWASAPQLQLGQVLLETDSTRAIPEIVSAVRKEPTNWRTWLVLARAEAEAGREDRAIEHLRVARDLNPRSTYWRNLDVAGRDREGPR